MHEADGLSCQPCTGVEPVTTAEAGWEAYVMEPGTESVMQDHFVVDRAGVYGFRFQICLSPGSTRQASSEAHDVSQGADLDSGPADAPAAASDDGLRRPAASRAV